MLLLVQLQRRLFFKNKINQIRERLIVHHEGHLLFTAIHEIKPEGEVGLQAYPILGHLILQQHEHGLEAPHYLVVDELVVVLHFLVEYVLLILLVLHHQLNLVGIYDGIEGTRKQLGNHVTRLELRTHEQQIHCLLDVAEEEIVEEIEACLRTRLKQRLQAIHERLKQLVVARAGEEIETHAREELGRAQRNLFALLLQYALVFGQAQHANCTQYELLQFGVKEVTLQQELLIVAHDLVSELLGHKGHKVMVAQ
jgi:hypothetical protein